MCFWQVNDFVQSVALYCANSGVRLYVPCGLVCTIEDFFFLNSFCVTWLREWSLMSRGGFCYVVCVFGFANYTVVVALVKM